MAYDYHTAIKRRLDTISDMGDDASTWEQLRAAKLREKQYANESTALNKARGQSFNFDSINGSGDAGFSAFLKAISGQESGGNYSARNKGSGAMGKYQIMPRNLGGARSGWDYEALGYDVSPAQFMSNPQIQEKIAQYKLKQYYDSYGPAGASVAWYAGPGAVSKMNSTAAQKGGPSISGYKNAILRRMRK